MAEHPKQSGFETKGRRFDLRAFAEEITPRREQYARMDDVELTRHREGLPRKVVQMMDDAITKLSRSVTLDQRGDGTAAERMRLELQHDLKALVWHLMLARLATQELSRRQAAGAA